MFWNLYKVELLSPFFRMKAEHDRSKNKKRQLRAALIKQHKIVFGKRRSFGYAVSPFDRLPSKDAGSIPTRS